MIATGKIIILAYPDTFVKHSDEWQCRLLPLVGLGTWNYIKAGHAAMILIDNETGKANYYDFGRYVTPEGYGRVRSAKTDDELQIPFKAMFVGIGPLENIADFLFWLDANPQKTHGKGRLIASVCEEINYNKALKYILDLQVKGNIPYGAFRKGRSNCSRFVIETILASTENPKIIKALKHNKKFTPSTVGNVEKASSSGLFIVDNGVIQHYTGSAFKENLKNYFQRKKELIIENSMLPKLPRFAQKLSGTGSNAWFEIELLEFSKDLYRVSRFNDIHQLDYAGVFEAEVDFNILLPYQITYDSHCEYCHIIQNNKKIKLKRIKTCPEFSLLQKAHSA